jgi:hypothetical protein
METAKKPAIAATKIKSSMDVSEQRIERADRIGHGAGPVRPGFRDNA